MLCHPLRAAAGNVGELELAFRSSSTSSASTITVPSDVVAGDLLVLYENALNASGFPTTVVVSGFSVILNNTSATTRRIICSYKIADGTEAGTSITGLNGTSGNSKILLAFSTGGATTAAAYDIAFQATDGDPTAQVVNASGKTTPLVVIAFMRQQTATGQSMSPTQDGTVTESTSVGYYKIYNSSPADVTADCGDGGTANILTSFYIRVLAPPTPKSLYDAINDLGLTTNLKLCLDAGDDASYDPAVQTTKWLDTSGNGYDFFRGTSTSGDAAEPVFNGTAGELDLQNYWYFDGGDYFLYDTTNEAWMQTLHKDGAIYSIFAVVYIPALGSIDRVFATRPSNATGFLFAKGATNIFQAQAFSGTTVAGSLSSTATATTGWNIVGLSLNENSGSNNGLIKVSSNSVETSTVSYSSPSTSDATGTAAIGSLASGTSPDQNGFLIACLAVWEGTALTSQNLTDLYDALKSRFGL